MGLQINPGTAVGDISRATPVANVSEALPPPTKSTESDTPRGSGAAQWPKNVPTSIGAHASKPQGLPAPDTWVSPASTKELFYKLEEKNKGAGFSRVGLVGITTHVFKNGTLLLVLRNDEPMTMHAFLYEAKSRNLLQPGATIATQVTGLDDLEQGTRDALVIYLTNLEKIYNVKLPVSKIASEPFNAELI
jgi:hypothetical protein